MISINIPHFEKERSPVDEQELHQLGGFCPTYSGLVALTDKLRSHLDSGSFDHLQCMKIATTLVSWASVHSLNHQTYTNKCLTEANLYIEFIISHVDASLSIIDDVFYHTQWNKFRLLDIVLKVCSLERFNYCFELLAKGYTEGVLSKEVYVHIVTQHLRPQYSLLHELILLGDPAKFKVYIETIAKLGEQGLLSYQEYLHLFRFENVPRFSVAAQAINGPSYEICQFVLDVFSVTLNPLDHYLLLASPPPRRIDPRRGQDKDGCDQANRLLYQQRLSLLNTLNIKFYEKRSVLYNSFNPFSERCVEQWATPLRILVSQGCVRHQTTISRFSPPVSPVSLFQPSPTSPCASPDSQVSLTGTPMTPKKMNEWLPSSMRS